MLLFFSLFFFLNNNNILAKDNVQLSTKSTKESTTIRQDEKAGEIPEAEAKTNE